VVSQAPNDSPALELQGISRRFGGLAALEDVSLAVRPGTVHALLGENGAGKSTLMRIAFGMLQPDAGRIRVAGTARTLSSPAAAIAAGIGMVHQHFTLVPAMTVAENLALGGSGRYDARAAAARVARVAEQTGFALHASARVETLPVGAQQRVEIAKALVRRARVLVLDEPTAVLAPPEVDELLRWLRRFVADGNAAVLITHKLREALAAADDVTVLRRGRVTLHVRAADTSAEALTAAMLGDDPAPAAAPVPSRARHHADVFVAAGLTVADGDRVHVRDATFTLRAGEITGVLGVEGSGQRELLRALAGRRRPSYGTLTRPDDVGFVPEDRHHDAVLLDRSIAENVLLRGAGGRRGTVDWAAARRHSGALMDAFDVRASGPQQRLRALSGGNQQKLVLARELGTRDTGRAAAAPARGAPPEEHRAPGRAALRHPFAAGDTSAPQQAIVLENPTRGLDVRATAAIHARLRAAAAGGAAVVVYSSDLDEVLALAARVLVVYDGTVRVTAPHRDTVGRAMLGLA
jgi:simple sugar transport system ATP-binding protein